jgi:ferredoxin
MPLGPQTIGVDRIRCDAHGVCAELLPERIRLDDWGYPIIDPTPIGHDLVPVASRAVRACPRLALRLETTVPSPATR